MSYENLSGENKCVLGFVGIVSLTILGVMLGTRGCTEQNYKTQEAKWKAVQEAVKYDHIIIDKEDLINLDKDKK